MTSYTQYKDPTDTSTGLSPIIWADCPTAEILHGGAGYQHFDDFTASPLIGAITTTIGMPPYTMFGGATGTVTYPVAAVGGYTKILTSAANEATVVSTDSKPFQITANAGKLWFECRLSTSTIVTNEMGWFVGLVETITESATVPLTATSALADVNIIGFHKPEANTTAFDFSYKANSVTAVEMGADLGTLVEGTYVKLGFIFDPTNSTSGTANQLTGFINGAQIAAWTNHPKTIPDATGTDFPADVRMGLCAAVQGATTTDEDITMDWWRCAQLRTS